MLSHLLVTELTNCGNIFLDLPEQVLKRAPLGPSREAVAGRRELESSWIWEGVAPAWPRVCPWGCGGAKGHGCKLLGTFTELLHLPLAWVVSALPNTPGLWAVGWALSNASRPGTGRRWRTAAPATARRRAALEHGAASLLPTVAPCEEMAVGSSWAGKRLSSGLCS